MWFRVMPAIALLFVSACRQADTQRPIGAEVKVQPPLGLPAVPIPPDNPPTAETVALGRKLFYDPRLSANDTLSCASCHNPLLGFADGRKFSTGVGGKT